MLDPRLSRRGPSSCANRNRHPDEAGFAGVFSADLHWKLAPRVMRDPAQPGVARQERRRHRRKPVQQLRRARGLALGRRRRAAPASQRQRRRVEVNIHQFDRTTLRPGASDEPTRRRFQLRGWQRQLDFAFHAHDLLRYVCRVPRLDTALRKTSGQAPRPARPRA